MKHLIKTMAFTLLGLVLSVNLMADDVAPVNTVLWGENFAHFSTNTPSSAGTGTGTTIYDGASITYVQSSTDTKGYNEKLAGGTAPELLLSKSNQTWTISGIKSGAAKEISLTFLSNKTTFSLTCSSDAYTVSGSQKSWTLTLGGGKTAPETFNLTLKNTGSSNARVDNVELKVTKAGASKTPLTTPSGLTVGTKTATTAEVSWSSVTDAGSYKVEYKTSSASTWTAVSPNPTNTSCTITGLTSSTTYNWRVTAIPSASAATTKDNSSAANGDNFTTAAPAKHKVYFSANGTIINTGGTEVTEGNAINFPETASGCEGKTFMGWVGETDKNYQSEKTAPTYITSATMGTQDITYYAVFADASEGGTTSVIKDIIKEAAISASVTLNTDNNPYQMGELPITLTGAKGTNNFPALNYNSSNGTDLRFYKGSTCAVTIATTNNQPITKIEFKKDATTASSLSNITANVGTLTDNVWTGSAKSVKFTYDNTSANFSGQIYIINVTYSATGGTTYSNYTTTCAAPRDIDHIEVTGTPAEFWKGDEFNHTGMTVKAYYTEGDPDDVTGSATYSGYDMSVAGEQTVTVTYKGKTATYTIDVKTIANTQATAYTATEAIAKYTAGKDLSSFVYVKGIVSKIVTEFSSQYGNISFNVSADGETTGDQFQFYRNFKGADKAKWASADEAPQVGDEVIGYGTLTAFGETYEFAEGNYIVSLTRPKKLTSITVSGTPDYFDTQSSFNHNGMTVTAHYNTGASDDADVTASAVFTAPDMTTEGEKTVNVSYTENEITKETSYKIQVAQYCANVVTITKGDEENGTFSLSQTGNICADGGLTISITDIVPVEHYHFKEITTTNGNVSGETVTDITEDATITVVFEEDNKYELKWMVSGEQMGETQSLYEGDDVTAPTNEVAVPAACANEGKVFVGWTAQKDYEHATDAPTFFTPHKMGTANETYYAVFATKGAEGAATTEELTKTNIQSITTPKLAYTTEKTFSGSTLSYSIYGNSDADGRPWIQQKNASGTYIKVTAPENIKQVELTITSAQNNKGGITEISEHTAYSGSVGLVTTDCAFTTESANVGITSTITNNKATITTTESTKEVMIKVTTGARIWGIKTTYGAGTTYSDYVTSCIIPTYSVTIQSNDNAMGSVTVDPDITEDAYEAGTEFTVMAEPTDEAVYRFIGWTITPDNTGATLDDATSPIVTFTTGAADVTLTANFEAIPADPITVTLEVGEHGTLDCVDCVNNTITEKTAGEGVLVPNVNANEGWAFLGWSTSSTATEAQYEVADIFLPSDDNKTLYAVYAQLYKVTLKYTDEVLWQETAGGAITLPARNCKNETYKDHFAGWSTTEFATETTNPETAPTIIPVGAYVPTADITLYPVFSVSTMGGTKWVKTTGDKVTEGIYAILCSSEKAFNGSRDGGHGLATETAFAFDANGVATSIPSGICEITMQAVDGGFKMYNADNGYLYATAASSGNLAWDKQGTSATSYWKWGGTSNQNWIYNSNSAYLRSYNDASKAFRTYGANNGDGPVHFAKKESVAENKYWSTPANDVTNPELDTPAGDYLSPLTVKITDASYDDNLIYYYTTDGTTPAADELLEPTGTSTMYDPTTGIVLEPAKTYNLQVIGYDEDGYTSQIASATYVLYPVFNSISAMYTGAVADKPVGLVLTNAYVHAVNTIGQNRQIFVQEGNLGVVLSTTSVPEGVEAGKQISGTAVGTYTITNARPQISQFAFQSTFTVADGSRPEPTTITETTADLVSTHLLRLVKLEGVYAQSDASKIIVVTENADGTGKSSNVYDFFNKVSTIPANDLKCNVTGLFNVREGVYSIMPILTTDFDVVEKQDAQLPTVNPLGSTVEAEPTKVANGETVTITPVAGFTTSYKVNDAAEWTTSPLSFNISETNTKLEIKATRPYYNDASATYYYEIDPGLTKYHITLPSVQTYYKIVSDVTDQKAGETVTLTISNITEHWNITGVTVEKADDETTTVEVANPETNIYTFVMPAYAVNVKVSYKSDPTYSIDYLRGITGSTGDDITESKQYAGVELALKECTWKAAGYTFKNWYAYYLDDESQEVAITITDNKIIVPAHDVKIKAMWDEAAWHKEGTWELVTKTTELGIGDYVIFTDTQEPSDDVTRYAGTSTVKKAGQQLALTTNISISGNKLTRLNNDGSMVFQLEEGNVENTYAFYADGIGYLNANGDVDDKNYMITSESKESNNASWAIESIDATTGEASVKAKSSKRNLMQVNVNNSIFAAYGSKQGGLAIYKFYPKAWIVTFDDNVEDEEISVPEMQRADPITNKVTISEMVPERTGYEFSKWNSAKVGTGVTSANPGDEITLSANTTLYAQWNIKQYNVAVEAVDNVTIQAKPYSEEAIAEGANADVNFKKSVVLTYSDVNEEYVFKSWKVTKADDETTVVPVSVGSSTTFEVPAYDVTVSAVIESKATTQLTVTYHANGGKNKTAGEPEEVSEQVNWNTTIKFAEHPCPFEKNLCTFVGWNTKADGTGTTYKTQVTVKTDIDLYAMWEASAVEYVIDNNVEAKVKVKEGVAPTGSAATFETTYTGAFGQLTKNNSGTLTLTGFVGKVITGVTMEMHSNVGSGAGTIVVKVGDKEICSTTYKESFGDYDNTTNWRIAELQNFNAAVVGENENITIVVSCTDNSLYINGYTIEYSEPEATVIRSGLTPSQYTTYCEPQKVLAGTYTGATFWNIAEKAYMSDGIRLYSITIEQHLGDLEAGVPYIMLPEATELTGVKYGDAVAEPAEEGNNGLMGVFEDTPFANFVGDEAAIEEAAVERGYYVISDGVLYLCGNNCGVYANRAYIQREQINPTIPTGAPRRVIGGSKGTPTGLLENIFGAGMDNIVRKMIINDKMYILRAGKMYDATGKFIK